MMGLIGGNVHVLYIHASQSHVDIGVDCYVYPSYWAVQSLKHRIN